MWACDEVQGPTETRGMGLPSSWRDRQLGIAGTEFWESSPSKSSLRAARTQPPTYHSSPFTCFLMGVIFKFFSSFSAKS